MNFLRASRLQPVRFFEASGAVYSFRARFLSRIVISQAHFISARSDGIRMRDINRAARAKTTGALKLKLVINDARSYHRRSQIGCINELSSISTSIYSHTTSR